MSKFHIIKNFKWHDIGLFIFKSVIFNIKHEIDRFQVKRILLQSCESTLTDSGTRLLVGGVILIAYLARASLSPACVTATKWSKYLSLAPLKVSCIKHPKGWRLQILLHNSGMGRFPLIMQYHVAIFWESWIIRFLW